MTCNVTKVIKSCKITKYGLSAQILSVQGWNLAGWCAARTSHFDSGYGVTIVRYSLPDLYLPKMKTALFVAPEFNKLCVFGLCNVHIRSHPLSEQQEQMTLSWRRKTLIFPFKWCCHGNVTVDMPWNFVMSVITVLSFSSIQEKMWEILTFFVILHQCPHCEITSHLNLHK